MAAGKIDDVSRNKEQIPIKGDGVKKQIHTKKSRSSSKPAGEMPEEPTIQKKAPQRNGFPQTLISIKSEMKESCIQKIGETHRAEGKRKNEFFLWEGIPPTGMPPKIIPSLPTK